MSFWDTSSPLPSLAYAEPVHFHPVVALTEGLTSRRASIGAIRASAGRPALGPQGKCISCRKGSVGGGEGLSTVTKAFLLGGAVILLVAVL
jgi:hypothetical protein